LHLDKWKKCVNKNGLALYLNDDMLQMLELLTELVVENLETGKVLMEQLWDGEKYFEAAKKR
jgi:hypothetical protein